MTFLKRFEGRVAVITGAAGGIGIATAERIGLEGGSVVLVDREDEKLKVAEQKLKAMGVSSLLLKQCDVSKPNQVEEVIGGTIDKFGKVDVIINNAGRMISKPIVDLTLEDWNEVLAVDLLGAFLFIRQGFLHMRPGSSIVNISSIHAIETTSNVSSYAAAKAGLVSLTRSAALEGKSKGIRVNAILPGAISTPMLWDNPNVKAGLESINMDDVGQPENVASAIAFLGSNDSQFIQGAALRVDGGRLASL
jgi:glucose 1-dehydrogenase